MPDNASGAWDLITVPWHLDEHIPDFPVPAGTGATIAPPLPERGDGEAGGAVPGRMTVLHRAVADAVAEADRPLLLSGDCLGLAPRAGQRTTRAGGDRPAGRRARHPAHLVTGRHAGHRLVSSVLTGRWRSWF
jgi:hypothetical protein